MIQKTSGYSSTLPMFVYSYEPVTKPVQPCTEEQILLYYRKIFNTMQLATECIIVSLIYLERMILLSKVEVRFSNWRALVFTSILLASKFWEDICFWNVDYVDALKLYPLRSVNRMESKFISLCHYKMYVSREMYQKYYDAIKERFLR